MKKQEVNQEKVRPLQKVMFVDTDQESLDFFKKNVDGFSEVVPSFYDDPVKAYRELLKNKEVYSVVLLEKSMQKMAAFEILNKINVNPFARYTQFLLMTDEMSEQDISDGLDAGAYFFLIKPFDRMVFRTVLKSALKMSFSFGELSKEAADFSATSGLLEKGNFTVRTPAHCEQVSSWLSKGCPNSVNVNLGLNELIINSIEHGNLEITYDEKTELMSKDKMKEEIQARLKDPRFSDRACRIAFYREKDKIVFDITDDGKGFDYNYYLNFTPERVFDNHGRGIVMAKNLYFDELEYIAPGNRVIASINLKEPK